MKSLARYHPHCQFRLEMTVSKNQESIWFYLSVMLGLKICVICVRFGEDRSSLWSYMTAAAEVGYNTLRWHGLETFQLITRHTRFFKSNTSTVNKLNTLFLVAMCVSHDALPQAGVLSHYTNFRLLNKWKSWVELTSCWRLCHHVGLTVTDK